MGQDSMLMFPDVETYDSSSLPPMPLMEDGMKSISLKEKQADACVLSSDVSNKLWWEDPDEGSLLSNVRSFRTCQPAIHYHPEGAAVRDAADVASHASRACSDDSLRQRYCARVESA
eukprot:16070_5